MQNTPAQHLSLSETTYLKGIGILIIMLHNIICALPNHGGEMEFWFDIQYTNAFFTNINNDTANSIKYFLGYFGHYGVQIFVFLSGYGLAMQYKNTGVPNYTKYTTDKFVKIYPALLGGVLLYAATLLVLDNIGAHKHTLNIYTTLVLPSITRLLLLSNFIPNKATEMCGPWWFFALIIQFYLLFPFLLKLKTKQTLLSLIGFVWFLQICIYYFAIETYHLERYNSLGHLPEFCFGILCATYGLDFLYKKPIFVATISLSVLWLSCYTPYIWIFSFSAAVALVISVYLFIKPVLSTKISRVFLFFGKNSLYFFTINGIFRIYFVNYANFLPFKVPDMLLACVYIVLLIPIALIFKFFVENVVFFVKKYR